MVKKIVIVDDERNLCDLLSQVLTKAGFKTHAVYNGKEALEKIKEIIPDLVILDVILPDLTGHQILKILKESDKTKNIPVLMLTQKDLLKDVEHAMELGATRYLIKPFDIERLLKVVKDMLNPKNSVE